LSSQESIKDVVVDARVFADYYFIYPKRPERHTRRQELFPIEYQV
jgi:hypothetical protein